MSSPAQQPQGRPLLKDNKMVPITPTAPKATHGDTSASQHPAKLHGRAFYESIGSPKFVLAPMVDQSEFAWRLLTRTFMTPTENTRLLAYSPMFHARMFAETARFREAHFQPVRGDTAIHHEPEQDSKLEARASAPVPYLDGNPSNDRPLLVQFCANDADTLLSAARHVVPYCDAVDLNLGCPQGIARKGQYGAFLQEDIPRIEVMISTLYRNLSVPVTAKIRILEDREKTLDYARRVVGAGASILTIHGRTRDMKGHKTGLADWETIRWVRERLPAGTVVFANGNILCRDDIEQCLTATGADAVMSAEGNLCDPGIFAEPPPHGHEGTAYWRDEHGKGGWRMDEVTRRYLDIIYEHVLEVPVPKRKPLYDPARDLPEQEVTAGTAPDGSASSDSAMPKAVMPDHTDVPVMSESSALTTQPNSKKRPASEHPTTDASSAKKRRRRKDDRPTSPNLVAMQPHLFHLLRPLVARHTDIRDKLARCHAGDLDAYESVLADVERVCEQGMRVYVETGGASWRAEEAEMDAALVAKQMKAMAGQASDQRRGGGLAATQGTDPGDSDDLTAHDSSLWTVRHHRRPWWCLQPYVRPLPIEAMKMGSWVPSKKERIKMMESTGGSDAIVGGPASLNGSRAQKDSSAPRTLKKA